MSYSCCDFTDDIVAALNIDTEQLGEPNCEIDPSDLADAALEEIERLLDLARNVGGLDLYGVAHMSPDGMRATLLEYREQAQRILNRRQP